MNTKSNLCPHSWHIFNHLPLSISPSTMQRQAIARLRTSFPWTSVPLIVGAPMRVLSGPSLAVEVSKAGGLEFVGPGRGSNRRILGLRFSRLPSSWKNPDHYHRNANPTYYLLELGFRRGPVIWNNPHAFSMGNIASRLSSGFSLPVMDRKSSTGGLCVFEKYPKEAKYGFR